MQQAADYPKKRKAIYEVAMALIRKQGVQHTTVKQICNAAGISNGTFFHYFKSKDALLSYYLEDAYDEYLASCEMPNDDDPDFISKTLAIYGYYCDYCAQAGADFIAAYYLPTNPALNTEHFSPNNTLNTTMMKCLQWYTSAQVAGQMSTEVDPVTATIDCCAIVKGCIFSWCTSNGTSDFKAQCMRTLRGYLEALRLTP